MQACQSQAWKREHKKSCKFLNDGTDWSSAVRAARDLGVLMTSDSVGEETKQAVRRMEGHDQVGQMLGAADARVDKAVQSAFGYSNKEAREAMLRKDPNFFQKNGTDPDLVGKVSLNFHLCTCSLLKIGQTRKEIMKPTTHRSTATP